MGYYMLASASVPLADCRSNRAETPFVVRQYAWGIAVDLELKAGFGSAAGVRSPCDPMEIAAYALVVDAKDDGRGLLPAPRFHRDRQPLTLFCLWHRPKSA